ncbi:M23 family metallopeptidase [Moraxella canis]|uniref:M23 family metallopeptidase n=1 Tax=Moraxella canis TaxID=90239 RepID=A0ABZ0WYB6_9GAMM|nr:M23 family metallopeptidase [Moraxella canis]WQE04221.1 M23 family metallopeptidase [Moraxella canis]
MTVTIIINSQTQRPIKRLGLVFGVITTCILAGCASKPTYNSASSSGGSGMGSQVITDSKGVPNRYQVKQGDTVSKIAQRYGLNWREIGRINNLNSSYTIYTGQWLTLWSGDIRARERSIRAGANTARTPAPVVTQSRPPVQQRPVVQAPTPTPPVVQQPAPVVPTVTEAPFATGSSGVMQFRYPVGTTNPVVRRFGTATVAGSTVTSNGMWFSGRDGDAINASNAGTVIQADRNMDGASIVIQHTNGFVSSYIHIKDAQVSAGDTVRTGQRIASMKNQPSGAALFEFRISRNGVYVDPLTVLK